MSGLLLLAAAALWVYVLRWMVNKIGRHLPDRPGRVFVKLGIFVLLLPLPLIDEIVGGRQFAELCKRHNTIEMDREKVKGATIYFEPVQSVQIQNLWIPVRLQPWRYVAPATGKAVVSYETLHAKGGLLIRSLRLSEGNVPLTFKDSCAPQENIRQLFAALQITAIDKPNQIQKEK